MKMFKKIALGLTVTSLGFSPIFSSAQVLTQVKAIEQQVSNPQRELSLGASLTQQEIEQTKALLGASGQPVNQTVMVDGVMIDKYLHIGSNASTGVFSSGLIETLPQGSGVQVQVVTPQNIQYVKPVTYQNAAITSGAKDVLIKIASVKPVTGEGALAGIYALLEKAGMKVDHKAIQVAEKEIQLVEQVKKETPVTDAQINQLILEIKTQITQQTVNKKEVNIDQIVQNVLDKHKDIQLTPETIKVLKQVAKDFANTEAAKNKQTVDQLKNSIHVDNKKPYAVDLNQFGGLATFQREGMNIPNMIQVTSKDNYVYFGENQASYKAEFKNIDTKEVTAIATDGSTRKVKVNTAIRLSQLEGTSPGSDKELYLFFNKDGQISLLTPNYAGNSDTEGMLEYQLTENPKDIHVTDPDPEKFPYMVNIDELGDLATFVLEGANIPNKLTLNFKQMELQYEYPETKPYKSFIEVSHIPTQEITVQSADGSGQRQVQVNTVIRSNYGTETLYLFVNNQGGFSLATPNYAGNVDEADKHVMLEYHLDAVGTIPEESTTVPESSEQEGATTTPQETTTTQEATSSDQTTVEEVTSEDASQEATSEQVTSGDESSEQSEMTSVSQEESDTTVNETTSAEETTVGEASTPAEETTLAEETTVGEDYPYMVDIANITEATNFYSNGMNVPNNILLDPTNSLIKFLSVDGAEDQGNIEVSNIPTKEIRIASHDGSGVRTIKVNTEIVVTGTKDNEEQRLYLFMTNNGQLALATPNYAGNVDEQDKDVMLEYLVGTFEGNGN